MPGPVPRGRQHVLDTTEEAETVARALLKPIQTLSPVFIQDHRNTDITKCPGWSSHLTVGETLLSLKVSLARCLPRSHRENAGLHHFLQSAHTFSVSCLPGTRLPIPAPHPPQR